MKTSKSENGYYGGLKQIAKVANSTLPLRRILSSIAKSTAKAMRANGCSVMLLDSQREYLTVAGAYGLSDSYLRKGPLLAHKSLPGILDGKVVAVTDASKNEQIQYPEVAKQEKIISILGAPLIQNEEVIGEIRVYTHELRQYSQADKTFLLTVGNISAITMERAELYQMLSTNYKKPITERTELGQIPKLAPSLLRPSSFAHPSEQEFSKLLDFYRLEWLYEPRAFPLQQKSDKVTEMFTPDFYLPELDLYVELTTLKQSLITEKNRKLRRLKKLYPEINIKLLTKSDYLRLLAKYGYGPIGEAKVQGISQVLFSHSQIQHRARTIAKRISRDYAGRHLVLVGILKGVICFMADLMQHISLPVTVEFMAISYYGDDTEQVVKITKDLDSSITGQDVLMIEDIVDTGMTLNFVLNHLSTHNPASLHVCTLLDKSVRRLVHIPLKYIGFEVPDEFVVGYGLDYQGKFRNLPFIGTLTPELLERELEKE